MLAKVHSACLLGVEAQPVEVQVHMGQGLPGFELVGLPEAAVRESRVRVRAAISSSGKELPPQKIVVNLAPADLKKSGSSFDLAIGVAVVAACGGCGLGVIDKTLIVGELTLGAEINPVRGVLAYLRAAARFGLKKAIVPLRNAREAALVTEIEVLCANTFSEVLSFLDGRADLMRAKDAQALVAANMITHSSFGAPPAPDFQDVRGQHAAKRALEIAAAGRPQLHSSNGMNVLSIHESAQHVMAGTQLCVEMFRVGIAGPCGQAAAAGQVMHCDNGHSGTDAVVRGNDGDGKPFFGPADAADSVATPTH